MANLANKRNILQLVALMRSFGISDVILCPGSRNAPLAHTFASVDFFRCLPVTDERSAAFVALGMADALCRPVAVCCTSGSALLNMAPAVAEAAYRRLPLLVISADRPAAWIGQMDGQTIVQVGSFSPHARTFDVVETDGDEADWQRNRVLNEALLALSSGPVHVNVPVSEPLFDFSAQSLPVERVVTRESCSKFSLSDAAASEWKSAVKPMIIVGQLSPDSQALPMLAAIVASRSCVVLAEQLSNLQHTYLVSQFDAIIAGLTPDEEADLAPDVLIYLGGHVVSKHLRRFLRRNKPLHCWHVAEVEAVIDTFECVTRMMCAKPEQFLHSLPLADASASRPFVEAWRSHEVAWRSPLTKSADVLWTEAEAVAQTLAAMPEGLNLVVANSSAVRLAQRCRLPRATRVYCNRGVNGIDGCVSTAVGTALASDRLTLLIVGDLSFFYDLTALWNMNMPANLRILLLNNGCGDIFHNLKGLEASPHLDTYVAARHDWTAEGWVVSCACGYERVSTMGDMPAALHSLFSPQADAPVVVECIF